MLASASCRARGEPPGRGDHRRRRNEFFGAAPARGTSPGIPGPVMVLGRAVVLHRPLSERDRARRGVAGACCPEQDSPASVSQFLNL